MSIQKMAGDDLHGARSAAMSVPEVNVPRSNPLLMIWRRRGVLVIVTLACVLAALGRYYISPRVYRSEARLFVQAPGKGGDPAASTNTLKAQCSLITSASVLADVLGSPEVAALKTMNVPQRWSLLKESLAATLGKEDDIITVTFDGPDAREAQVVLQAVINSYTQFHNKEKRAQAGELEKWRGKLQLELDKKQKEVLAFKKANGAVSLSGEKGNLTLQTLQSFQDALTQAHLETVNARHAAESTKTMLADPAKLKQFVEYLRSTGVLTASDTNEAALRTQLMAMEQQMDELRRRYLPSHPAIRASEGTVASLRARIAELERGLVQTHLLALEQKVTAAKNREAELQQSYDTQKKLALEVNAKAAELEQLEGEAKRLANSVENAELKISNLTDSENAGGPTIQVFDQPNEPLLPIKPNRTTMLLNGLMVGLILGCVAALLRDFTDQGMRSAEEVTQTLGVGLLGSLPHIAGPPNPMAHGRKVDLEPASDVAEIYRTIRTAVFFGTPERESRTILVTSPGNNDGKSTFASNLAIAMAQTGKRVLLLDCDLRKPVQQRVFECRPGVGLSTVLTGKDSLDQSIQNSGIAGLDILPSGPIPNNPAEILNSQSFNEVLEELSVRYEHVVVDAPPVLGFADARILAAMCSVSVLVLRANTSTRKAALHARKALESVGAHLLGVVVNDVPRSGEFGDYGNYGAYRARYGGNGNSPEAAVMSVAMPTPAPAPAPGKPGLIPAQSFLDLRRK